MEETIVAAAGETIMVKNGGHSLFFYHSSDFCRFFSSYSLIIFGVISQLVVPAKKYGESFRQFTHFASLCNSTQ